jgi:hypothetical protein
VKPLRSRIREAVRKYKLPQPVIEKDYALSYILAGIAPHQVLGESLVFKGGTALKKLFFGNYRFSEDLDFSAEGAPKNKELQDALQAATKRAAELLSVYGPFTLQLERYLEREPHPQGQEAFTVRMQFPWQQTPLCRIKLEITHDEPVMLTPEPRPLIHGYDESLPINIRSYRLEEIVAEKMRTLLQTHNKLVARGWNRPRARDYYDLWRILDAFGNTLKNKQLLPLLESKCRHRRVTFHCLDDFFSEQLVSEAYLHWDNNLKPFVSDLPACQEVMEKLRPLLLTFFPALK